MGKFEIQSKSMKPQSDPASRGPLSSQGIWNPLQKASPFQSHDSRGFAQEPLGLQEKQVLQGPVKLMLESTLSSVTTFYQVPCGCQGYSFQLTLHASIPGRQGPVPAGGLHVSGRKQSFCTY